jgi:putative flippase GtrA
MLRLTLLIRHQAGSIVATIVDFTVMIALVSLAGAAPAVGTAAGASCGGIANFLLGRRWIFRATQHHPAGQAGRYAMVSLGSLVLNTCGMHVLASVMHQPYVAARLAVSFVVSVLWNFPMQRSFVFGGRST